MDWAKDNLELQGVSSRGQDQRIHPYKIVNKPSNFDWMELCLQRNQQWDTKLTKSPEAGLGESLTSHADWFGLY